MTKVMERRIVTTSLSLRTAGKGTGTLSGYAATFNNLSNDLGGFKERIAPGAFSSALKKNADVRCLVNHDPSLILGRTKAGTLTLREDSVGLSFDCELPDTSTGRDIRTLIQRGDISQCSFSFQCGEGDDEYQNDMDENGKFMPIRTIRNLNLFDVSAVTYPAYEQTSVSARAANYDTRRAVELATPVERQQIADMARRDRAKKNQQAIDHDYWQQVQDNMRTGLK